MKQMITVPKNSVVRIALIVGGLLLIPLTFTLLNPNATIYGGPGGGADWMPGDFLVMGALLFIAGLAIDAAVRNIIKPAHKIAAVLAILAVLVLIWVELAVDAVSQLITFLFSVIS